MLVSLQLSLSYVIIKRKVSKKKKTKKNKTFFKIKNVNFWLLNFIPPNTTEGVSTHIILIMVQTLNGN